MCRCENMFIATYLKAEDKKCLPIYWTFLIAFEINFKRFIEWHLDSKGFGIPISKNMYLIPHKYWRIVENFRNKYVDSKLQNVPEYLVRLEDEQKQHHV